MESSNIESNVNGNEADFGRITQSSTSVTMGKAIWFLFAFLVLAGIEIVGIGYRSDCLWLGVGSVIAGVAMFGYGSIFVSRAYGGEKESWMSVAAIGGLIPYLYGLYVIGYWGLWPLYSMGTSFVIWSIAKSGIFILLGYKFLRIYYELTEIGSRVQTYLKIVEKYKNVV